MGHPPIPHRTTNQPHHPLEPDPQLLEGLSGSTWFREKPQVPSQGGQQREEYRVVHHIQ